MPDLGFILAFDAGPGNHYSSKRFGHCYLLFSCSSFVGKSVSLSENSDLWLPTKKFAPRTSLDSLDNCCHELRGKPDLLGKDHIFRLMGNSKALMCRGKSFLNF